MRNAQSLASLLSLVSLLISGGGATEGTTTYPQYYNLTSSPSVYYAGTGSVYNVLPTGKVYGYTPSYVPSGRVATVATTVVCYSVDCTVACPTPPSSNSEIKTLPYTSMMRSKMYPESKIVVMTAVVVNICPTGLITTTTAITQAAPPARLPIPPGTGGPAPPAYRNSTMAYQPPMRGTSVPAMPTPAMPTPAGPIPAGPVPGGPMPAGSPPAGSPPPAGTPPARMVPAASPPAGSPPLSAGFPPAVTLAVACPSCPTPAAPAAPSGPGAPPVSVAGNTPMKPATGATASSVGLYSNAAVADRPRNGRGCFLEILLTSALSFLFL